MIDIKRLKILSRIILFLGLVSAIIIWYTLLYIEVPNKYYEPKRVFNLGGLILGLEVILASIILWAFTLVFCGIAEDIKITRKSLDPNNLNDTEQISSSDEKTSSFRSVRDKLENHA